jgi:prepilin-type N-terminal cleavage/methylation domain-containing protein/prepilin-type processing-associated H-X9-DG protein
MLRPQKNDRCRAFTLIELLVVVTIIVLLLSMLLPAMRGSLASAERAACMSNMKQLALAHNSYAGDNFYVHCTRYDYLDTSSNQNEWCSNPVTKSILILMKYLDSGGVFMCPGDNGTRTDIPGVSNYVRPANFSYTRNVYNGVAGTSRYCMSSPSALVDITRPSEHCIVAEESELAPMNGCDFWANTWDIMSLRHANYCGMNFFDGHAGFINAAEYNDDPQPNYAVRMMYLNPQR